jgi:N-acetylglucosaminyl-diphospho-decaprenol L-rhamnosyltransferase
MDVSILVWDNASHDGSADVIAEAFPNVRLIRSSSNDGFAKANNLAARESQGDYLLLLNPDTEILDGAVQRAVAFARQHLSAGIVGGRTYFADGGMNYNSCHGAPTLWSMFCKGVGLSSMLRRSAVFNPEDLGRWNRDTVREVDAVSGCFLLIRRDLWNQLRGFDETFFMYGEDTDLCMRAWAAGAKCVICPDVTLIHHGGASEPLRADKMVRLFRAKAQLMEKHWRYLPILFGVQMLKMWAGSRTLMLGIFALLRPSLRSSYVAWKQVWLRRSEYSTGPFRRAGDSVLAPGA